MKVEINLQLSAEEPLPDGKMIQLVNIMEFIGYDEITSQCSERCLIGHFNVSTGTSLESKGGRVHR